MSISIFVTDVHAKMAPMRILSELTGEEHVCTGRKGQLLLRDVDTIHAASPNDSDDTRVLPAFRFVTRKALRLGYAPTAFVDEATFQTFPPEVARAASFLRKSAVREEV